MTSEERTDREDYALAGDVSVEEAREALTDVARAAMVQR